MWENNSESTTVMKKISFLEKDITLRKNLVQKAEDVEVLFEFLNENQVEEEEVKKELKIFSNLLKEFELKLILNGDNDINKNATTMYLSTSKGHIYNYPSTLSGGGKKSTKKKTTKKRKIVKKEQQKALRGKRIDNNVRAHTPGQAWQ
mgnify:CR=1 FL=1